VFSHLFLDSLEQNINHLRVKKKLRRLLIKDLMNIINQRKNEMKKIYHLLKIA
jgi:hypothetical protein